MERTIMEKLKKREDCLKQIREAEKEIFILHKKLTEKRKGIQQLEKEVAEKIAYLQGLTKALEYLE